MTMDAEGWVILKYIVGSDGTYYKVFASWGGGYISGDSWRLSSGSEEFPTLSPCGKHWLWPQLSGTIYKLPVNGESRLTSYNKEVLESILSLSGEMDTIITEINIGSVLEKNIK